MRWFSKRSEKEEIKSQVEKVLILYLNNLRVIDKEDEINGKSSLSLTLDLAALHKKGSVENAGNQVFHTTDGIKFNVDDFYRYPDLFDNNQLIMHLKGMAKQMKSYTNEREVLAGMTIYYLSAAAFAFPELRSQVEEMWIYLKKGFSDCETFDPKLDAPIDLISSSTSP